MTPTSELLYCLRGTEVCQTHRVARHAWERYINSEVAALTRVGNAALNQAIITGIWGKDRASVVKGECDCEWADWSVLERGNDADWLARCSCRGQKVLMAEHKPRGAVPHWKTTALSAFSSRAIISRPSMDWLLAVDSACDVEHNIASCQANHPRFYRDTDEKSHLAAPQILSYCQVSGSEEINEVTIINDSGSVDVNVIWDSNDDNPRHSRRKALKFPIFLDTAFFPVRTTGEVLNDIAEVLPWQNSAGLTKDQRASLRAIIEAMWVRAGVPEISPAVAPWIRQDVRDCISESEHELSDEDQPSGHDFRSWNEYVGSARETS